MKGLRIGNASNDDTRGRAALWFAVVILAVFHVALCVKLIDARHELRALRGEFKDLPQMRQTLAQVSEDVTEHDEMLETVGDDVTILENKFAELAAHKTRRTVRK